MTVATDELAALGLAALDPTLRARLEARGFDPAQLAAWAANLAGDPLVRNRLPGRVAALPDDAIASRPTEEDRRVGDDALRGGEVALCVLAGGMATRMGGVIKALLPAVAGRTFLQLRLAERAVLGRRYGAQPPLWLMTSEPTETAIAAAIGHQPGVATFEQFVSLRLTPTGTVFRDDQGIPSVYATGHGDLPDALKRSGLLQHFVAAGGRYVWLCNIDNLGASIDPALLGQHIASDAQLTVEVVDKYEGDTGGGPVLHDGVPMIAEHFRLPVGFDAGDVGVFNTNTFIVDAQALLRLDMAWTYLQVHKNVGRHEAVQFERLLGEISVGLRPRFVRVPREGADSRFMPIKSHADLAAAQAQLGAMMHARDVPLNS